jgi:hypothetical protein
LAKGQWRVDLSFRHTSQTSVREGGDAAEFVFRPKLLLEHGFVVPAFHQDVGGNEKFLQLDVARGLGRTTTVLASLPILARRSYEMGHGGVLQQYTTEGFGDFVIGVRQSVRGAVLGFSVKVPTGESDVGGDVGDTILDPTLQPGSGSWDLVSSLQHSRRWFGANWTLAGSYQWTTTNGFGYRFGREAIASVAGSRSLGGPVTVSGQAKLFHKGRALYRGEGVASTGVTFLYLGPGVQVNAPGGVSVYGYCLFAPYRYVNDAQLTPHFSLTLGLSRTF